MKVYYAAPPEGVPPLVGFLTSLEQKLRQKIFFQLAMLSHNPALGEPHVKHFKIAKYNGLYELRTKSKIMIRIIFTVREDGGVLLLEPFVKRHKRNTMQALDLSLKLLRQIDSGACSAKELIIDQNTWEVIT